MHSHFRDYLVVATFTCGLVFVVLPGSRSWASGVTVVVDEAGRKIYINADEQTYRYSRQPSDSRFRIPDSRLASLIEKTAERFQVDPGLVHAIVQVESEYNPRARSRKGALGLMQLIPATAERFGVGDPYDPAQSLEGGVTYLKYLLDLFKGDVTLSLAAYNAGENSVFRQGGIPPFSETRNYVRKVKELYGITDSGVQIPKSGVQSPESSGAEASKSVDARLYRYVDAEGVAHYEQ